MYEKKIESFSSWFGIPLMPLNLSFPFCKSRYFRVPSADESGKVSESLQISFGKNSLRYISYALC